MLSKDDLITTMMKKNIRGYGYLVVEGFAVAASIAEAYTAHFGVETIVQRFDGSETKWVISHGN